MLIWKGSPLPPPGFFFFCKLTKVCWSHYFVETHLTLPYTQFPHGCDNTEIMIQSLHLTIKGRKQGSWLQNQHLYRRGGAAKPMAKTHANKPPPIWVRVLKYTVKATHKHLEWCFTFIANRLQVKKKHTVETWLEAAGYDWEAMCVPSPLPRRQQGWGGS